MSRIGNLPVTIPSGVTVAYDNRIVTVTGPKGVLTLNVPPKINIEIKDGQVVVSRLSEDKKVKSCHGSTRAHINNMVQGVTTFWQKDLEIRGTGYKFVANGNKLTVTAGYINPVVITAPEGIFFQVRKIRKPEPYKGKGIRYLNEFIKLKAGKTAKA
jgi:large subunit ribosomal protein L6